MCSLLLSILSLLPSVLVRSFPNPSIHCLGDALSQQARLFVAGQFKRAATQARQYPRHAQIDGERASGQQASKFLFDGCLQAGAIAVRDGQTVQDEPFDVDADVHTFAPCAAGSLKSASLMGRSSLRYSARAAFIRNFIVTLSLSRAAINAALRATL